MDENIPNTDPVAVTPNSEPAAATPIAEPVAVTPIAEPVAIVPNNSSGKAIVSMILGLVAIAFCCAYYITIPCAIISIVFGAISLKNNEKGRGMAIAGLVLSITALIFIVIVLATAGAFLGLLKESFRFPEAFDAFGA